MAKGRWKKLDDVNNKVIEVLKKKPGAHLTTQGVMQELEKRFNLKISWKTLNKYLKDMAEMGHVKSIIVEKGNKFYIWTLKGVDDGN